MKMYFVTSESPYNFVFSMLCLMVCLEWTV